MAAALGFELFIQLRPQLPAGVFTWGTREGEVTIGMHRAVAQKHSLDFSLHILIATLSLPHGAAGR